MQSFHIQVQISMQPFLFMTALWVLDDTWAHNKQKMTPGMMGNPQWNAIRRQDMLMRSGHHKVRTLRWLGNDESLNEGHSFFNVNEIQPK